MLRDQRDGYIKAFLEFETVVLNKGQFRPLEYIWQHLESIFVLQQGVATNV